MARKKRTLSPTGIYHWIVRGIHKKHIFHHEQDFAVFKDLLCTKSREFNLSIYHYCLMNNHAHLLIDAGAELAPMIGFSSHILRKYAYYYCGAYKWTGSVFMRGYQSIPVLKEEHLLECARYIERNPVKACLALAPGQYAHSSFRAYKTGEPDALIAESPAFLGLDPIDDIRRRIYANYVETTRMQEKELLKAL